MGVHVPLTVEESDGSPSVTGVRKIKCNGINVTDDSNGVVTITGESADLSGSIATAQVAIGTGTDTIGGDNKLIFDVQAGIDSKLSVEGSIGSYKHVREIGSGGVTLVANTSEVGGQMYFNRTGASQTITLPLSAEIGSWFNFTTAATSSGIAIAAQGSDTVNGVASVSRGIVNDVNWCLCYATSGANRLWIVGNA